MESIDSVRKQLSSSTLKQRRVSPLLASSYIVSVYEPIIQTSWHLDVSYCAMQEGVKVLDTLLDSPVVLNQLDANTAKLWPEDKLTCKGVAKPTV